MAATTFSDSDCADDVRNRCRIILKKDVEDYLLQSFPETEDKSHLESLLQILTTSPLFTTLRTRLGESGRLGSLSVLAAELAKQCAALQWDPFEQFLHPALKDCVVVRNRGPFDLDKPSKEIVVDLSCGMAVLRGANVFKQGIIGAPHGLKGGDRVAVFCDLAGTCLKGAAAVYGGSKVHVGNGVSQVSRSDLFKAKEEILTGVGILMTDPVYQAPSLSDLDPAVTFPQNLPSVVCGHALDPRPGEAVLDMCAAPGGKTTHIALLMEGKGRLVALEKSAGRATKMRESLDVAGHSIVEVYTFDASKAVSDQEGSNSSGPPPYPPASFDRILVDAPCSALGQRPCLANPISLKQLKSFPVVQRRLLTTAVKLLKPGGVLVYSTCTLPREENEDQVCHVTKAWPDMELVCCPFTSSSGGLRSSQLSEVDRTKVLRFDPACPHTKLDPWDTDTIGFFIAKFRKRER